MFGILRKDYKWAWMTQFRWNMAKEPLSYFYYQRPTDHLQTNDYGGMKYYADKTAICSGRVG